MMGLSRVEAEDEGACRESFDRRLQWGVSPVLPSTSLLLGSL